MAITAHPSVSPANHLKLGRVSNLPTVWTNVLAGTILGGGDAGGARTVLVALAMSMFYTGGMYLNDYCDRHIDARERPERPIPRGEISQTTVAVIGYALLFGGIALMAGLGVVAAVVGVGAQVVERFPAGEHVPGGDQDGVPGRDGGAFLAAAGPDAGVTGR